jgi:hypothetical protein
MVLIEQDTVVVLTTSITTTARMLPVFADTTMAGTDMPALLAVLPEPCKQAMSSLLYSTPSALMCRTGMHASQP